MASTAGSASSAAPDEIVGSQGPPTASLSLGETCSFHLVSSATGCRTPRSCQSCLTATGCMVNPAGKCVSVDNGEYNPAIQYSIGVAQGLVMTEANAANPRLVPAQQAWQFPAGDVQYCSSSDATCRKCVASLFWRDNASLPDSRFCLGDDGACVCVDVCERAWFVAPDCSASFATLAPISRDAGADVDLTMEHVWRALFSVLVVLAVVVLVLVHRKRARPRLEREQRRRQEERRQERVARASEQGIYPLSLSGWESDRRETSSKVLSAPTESESDGTHKAARDDDDVCAATVYARLEDGESGGTRRTSIPTDSRSPPIAPRLPPLSTGRRHRASI